MKKPSLDIPSVALQSLASAESLLAEWLPDGKKQAGEWVALNPRRADARHGSFKVNLSTGKWSDFATGDKGGDLVSLYAYLYDCPNQLDAAKAVAAWLGLKTDRMPAPAKKKESSPQHTWTPIVPVPDDAPAPPKAHIKRGIPDNTWPYYDQERRVLCYVCRFTTSDGGKDIMPLTWCVNENGAKAWQWRGLPLPRPIYGLDGLVNHPEKPVLIVEGEKCAAFVPDGYVPISWIGGSNAVGKIDWSPLTGRDIVIWPDNDEPGVKAAYEIARLVSGIARSVRICDPPANEKQGFDIADAWADGYWSHDQIHRYLQAAKEYTTDEPDHATNIPIYTPPSPGTAAAMESYRHTDLGAAMLFADLYGAEIRYNEKPFKAWFWYDGVRWREDTSNRVYDFVDRMIKFLHGEVAKLEYEKRKPLATWALKLENMARQKALVAKAETLQRIAVGQDEFDRNGWLFNCLNCTLDLESGEVVRHDHTANDYITNLAPVVYDPAAVCPDWLKFIAKIFPDEDLQAFIRRAVGYSLVDDVSEQVLFFAFGTGANGKSVFFEALKYLLGDYAGKAPTEMLMVQQFSQIPTDVADLRGKRFVVASEVDEGKRWAESRLKDLTGGDTIKARRMREDFFEFRQTHKLWVFGNHKPILKGSDEGIKRRMRIVPFTVRIPDEEQIPLGQLLKMFRAEASGILNWALEGYIRWREIGLGKPAAVEDATQEYFDENDILKQFIEDRCEENKAFTIEAKKLYEAYRKWCEQNGYRYLASRAFYRVLEEHGLDKRNGSGNKVMIDGIALADIQEELGN